MLRLSSRCPRPGAAGAGAGDEVTSAPQQAQQGAAPPLDALRALLLQQVPAAVADLRRQHVEAEEAEQRALVARRLLLELLLRLCICAYGE